MQELVYAHFPGKMGMQELVYAHFPGKMGMQELVCAQVRFYVPSLNHLIKAASVLSFFLEIRTAQAR